MRELAKSQIWVRRLPNSVRRGDFLRSNFATPPAMVCLFQSLSTIEFLIFLATRHAQKPTNLRVKKKVMLITTLLLKPKKIVIIDIGCFYWNLSKIDHILIPFLKTC